MGIFSILLTGFALSMDAFAVAIDKFIFFSVIPLVTDTANASIERANPVNNILKIPI